MLSTVSAQEDYLPEVVDRIVRAFQPLRIILFGSVARGEASPDSDVDLLVVVPEVWHRREQQVAIRRVLADLPISKDVIVVTPEEVEQSRWRVDSVVWPAVQDGKTLYERAA